MNDIINAMSVDVEDYFQVAAFEDCISHDDWDSLPVRVEQNIGRILALFKQHGVCATFFILGWIAERYPQLVRDIAQAGHEIASHGYVHQRVTRQTRAQFGQDISSARKLLEDLTGHQVMGYRAPSYSINQSNLWAHDEIEQAGYRYSSSIYPVKHDLYGFPSAPRHIFACGENLQEIPISTLRLAGRNWSIGGGGYFRFYPYCVSKWAINRVNSSEGKPVIFYFHPWEIDTQQPKQSQARFKSKFRHYLNLHKTYDRLDRLLNDFSWGRVDQVFMNKQKENR